MFVPPRRQAYVSLRSVTEISLLFYFGLFFMQRILHFTLRNLCALSGSTWKGPTASNIRLSLSVSAVCNCATCDLLAPTVRILSGFDLSVAATGI
jgi:hypothetical protein